MGDSRQSVKLALAALCAGLLLFSPAWPPPPPALSGGLEGPLDCRDFAELTDLELAGTGWTKVVYRGKHRGKEVAVKMVNTHGLQMESCMTDDTIPGCYTRMSARILRELVILQQIDHPNVVKVLGSCIRSSLGPVLIATEFGDPLDTVALRRLSWDEKLKIAWSIASLLHHLAHSPLGSLAAKDLTRRQFVLVNGLVKLADVDDLEMREPLCKEHSDCELYSGTSRSNVQCKGGHCEGHNEYSNILQAGEDLVCHMLLDTGPKELHHQIKKLADAYKGQIGWDSSRILKQTKELVQLNR